MPRQAIVAAACCFTCTDACYCGSLCDSGCSASCSEGDANVCIAAAEWDAHIGDVGGIGTGVLIQVNGLWYFFDGTTGDCVNVAAARNIDWESATLADECPSECDRSLTITWTGSAAYEGICCEIVILATWNYTQPWTATHTNKTSPEMTLDSGCLDQNEDTADEGVSLGTACGESGLVDSSAITNYLNFRLERDTVNCLWIIRINGQGAADLCPNEAAGTGWLLVFTAPLSLCPPTTGWALDEALSTLPTVGTATCDEISVTDTICTEFTVGTVTIVYT